MRGTRPLLPWTVPKPVRKVKVIPFFLQAIFAFPVNDVSPPDKLKWEEIVLSFFLSAYFLKMSLLQ
jgi:hypothetical protein